MKKAFYIAAAAALLTAALTGAAVYTRWSSSLPQAEHTTQAQREEAEKNGLSNMPAGDPAPGEITSATSNGITVSVKQTLADRNSARLVFTISGYQVPEGQDPSLMPDLTFDGNPGSFGASGSFYTCPMEKKDGVLLYEDGTPVPMDADGDPVLRYETPEGNLEYIVSMNADDFTDCFGKKVHMKIQSLGTSYHAGYTPAVEGPWELSWTFKGNEDGTRISVEKPIGDTGIILKELCLSPLNLEVQLQLQEEFTGFDTLEQFRPALIGFRTRDGAEHRELYGGGSDIYEDRELGLFRMRRSYDGILEPEEIDAVLFADWDQAGTEILYTVVLP